MVVAAVVTVSDVVDGAEDSDFSVLSSTDPMLALRLLLQVAGILVEVAPAASSTEPSVLLLVASHRHFLTTTSLALGRFHCFTDYSERRRMVRVRSGGLRGKSFREILGIHLLGTLDDHGVAKSNG